ncbi:prephenate dehydrogenase [Mariniblastus fucicola]|uniref:prephenate dehydrogenase n=1 Tax=Mariniblastus fucicola TaxID=980251 RepID=A0A5B9PHL7_9BACT|nr:prephenate dehydrogenase/arogenate dehydrogenase family protein [Mariniblastus fucicola]QEG22371.1 cyclohexadienyl dehydrogenase [Mariniblastus fucicola]
MEKICIFGVGLIGGSLALALKEKSFCRQIVGCSRNESHLKRAQDLGAIDSWTLDPCEAAKDADLIFLATPVGAIEAVLKSIQGCVSEQTIITDGGSCKQSVVDAAERAFGRLPDRFVPGHPIAGKEKSGVDHADAKLYVDHKVILTPIETTDPTAVAAVTEMWETCGANVQLLNVGQHDQVLAATSHLPHVLAYALVETVANTTYVSEIFEFAAGGFRDSSRVASSDPTMWRDICEYNRDAILEMTSLYRDRLESLEQLIEAGDSDGLFELFSRARKVRDGRFG